MMIPDEYIIYVLAACAAIALLLILWFLVFVDCNIWLKLYAMFYPNKSKLKGKTVWIVGSSTGIGEELAYQLSKLNCKLILTSTSEAKLEQVKQNCIERSKGKLSSDDILVEAYDISDYSKNDEAFSRIVEKFGDIDILACNAAKASSAILMEEKFESTKRLFEINYFAHVYITKMVLKHWLEIKKRDGAKTLNKQILATSSAVAIIEVPFCSTYTATKKSFSTFFNDVAMQHQRRDGIYVTIVLPGPIESDLVKNMASDERPVNDMLTKMPTKRCVHLMLVSLANRFGTTWIAKHPSLLLIYIYNSFGSCMINLFRCMGTDSFEKQFYKQEQPQQQQ